MSKLTKKAAKQLALKQLIEEDATVGRKMPTPRQAHLLVCLIEELCEIQKPACKFLRFGTRPKYNRVKEIKEEWADVVATMGLLQKEGLHLRPTKKRLAVLVREKTKKLNLLMKHRLGI